MAYNDGDNVLWHLIAGTKGGPNRLQILYLLYYRPHNANQLTKKTKLDYKTIRHHLDILIKNGLVVTSKEKKYGELYHLTEYAEKKMEVFKNIWERIENEEL